MRRRFLLVENAVAGRVRRTLVARIESLLREAGTAVERCDAPKDDAASLVGEIAQRRACDAVLAAGGDGTIRQVARAVAGTGMPLGIIPVGTANVLAHELALPRAPAGLARVLLEGPAIRIKAPTANGELFLLMAGAGFDGRVIGALSHSVKGRFGKLAYAGPLLGALVHAPDALEVAIDGKSYRATWAIIANARHYGGRFLLAPGTRVQEVGLQAVLFCGARRHELIAGLLALASGQIARCRYAQVLPCTQAEIGSPAIVPVQVDGDAFGSTPLTVDCNGPEVSIIVPGFSAAAAC